ncbi:Proton-dependent oligopeptide transporter family [Sesbania bispinosa]|nr:Proton-dependent oligopeptide transporter family [Sesbania bispinosa]
MDYLTSSWEKENLRNAAIFTNLQDFLSCYFEFVLSLVSEAFTGCFTMITFSTAASTMGLMLLWISATSISNEFHMVYVAIVVLALGKAGQTLLQDFLEDQLDEKVKAKAKRESRAQHENTENKTEQDHIDKIRTNMLWRPACFAGNVLTVGISYVFYNQSDIFRFASLLMGAAGLIFFFGCARFSPSSYKNLPTEPNLGKINTIFNNHLYKHGQELRLLPKVPKLLGWLDKAAIIEEQSSLSPQRQERKRRLCIVKEVREVKSIIPLICLGFTFFAYSLVLATANTFFVEQTSNLRPAMVKNGSDIPLLFVAKSIMRDVSSFLCWLITFAKLPKNWIVNSRLKRIVGIIIRIGIGMVCALICCIIAWQVEHQRLSLIRKEGILGNPDGNISMTTMVLVPQFLMLGITEGLVEGGLTNLFNDIASKVKATVGYKSCAPPVVHNFLPVIEGKFFTIPFVLIFRGWIKETANTSHLDRYAYKEECPEDEQIEMQPISKHAPQQDSEETNATQENSAIHVVVAGDSNWGTTMNTSSSFK